MRKHNRMSEITLDDIQALRENLVDPIVRSHDVAMAAILESKRGEHQDLKNEVAKKVDRELIMEMKSASDAEHRRLESKMESTELRMNNAIKEMKGTVNAVDVRTWWILGVVILGSVVTAVSPHIGGVHQ